jgi:hypothetical protein
MTTQELYDAIMAAEGPEGVQDAVDDFASSRDDTAWHPVGGRPNNRGIIEVSSNTGRALAERVTNAIDAVLQAAHDEHDGFPACSSPRDAAAAWLNVPDDGLSGMTVSARRNLAKRVTVTMMPGDGVDARTITIADEGVGLTAEEMPTTILSLNESNKITKGYLAGTYGQGGSSTFASTACTLIASRVNMSDAVAFTIVKFREPPPDLPKYGSYEYLTHHGTVMQAEGDKPSRGTICRHFGYDLTKFPSPVGPNSVYGLMQQVLFDPVLPIWFDNQVHDYRRVIKGSRNALNGATDEGDESNRGPKLSHSVKMFHTKLGELGRVGFEYWVLGAPEKANKRPTAGYIDPQKPVILTLNGQNQEEFTATIIRKDAELPYLTRRLICHIDCNDLTPRALRGLLTSTREGARGGFVQDMIRKELVQVLRSDPDLKRLNDEAKQNLHREEDETAVQAMRKEVARLLRLQGIDVAPDVGATRGGTGPGTPPKPKPTTPKPAKPIELREPPTFIRIVHPDDEPIRLHPDDRRYVRVETDASSGYHTPKNPAASRINIVVDGKQLSLAGSTPLQDGRMRVILDCGREATAGDSGSLRVELARPGMATLSDSCELAIVPPPPAKPSKQQIVLPPFRVVAVDGPESDEWHQLDWDNDVTRTASSAVREDDLLVVYYSTVFPRYRATFGKLETKDPSLAKSFKTRYETWLAVHSLILEQDQQTDDDKDSEQDEAAAQEAERRERCRIAILSTFFASREVQTGLPVDED